MASLHDKKRLWQLRGQISRKHYWAIAAAGLLTPLLLWYAVAAAAIFPDMFLPSPAAVVERLRNWFIEEGLFEDIWVSTVRVVVGFLVSAVIALPLGLFIGTYAPVAAFFEPLTDFIRYMPAVAFIPLVMLWFGVEEEAKIAIIFIGTFFQMVLMFADNVRGVPMVQIEAGQTMGGTSLEILRHVVLPSALPALVDTMRVTMGWAWSYLVVAELVAANSGIGFAILQAQRLVQTDKIFVGIILIGFIGLIIDQIFRLIHRLSFPWLYSRK